MSSNKAKAPGKESPTDPFKRAVAGCLRAIARKPDLEVGFAAERPGMVGGKARLPEPPRRLTAAEAAIVRGHADSMALKLACHDPKVHRKLVPGGQARAVFDAIEQARVEAIGARRMTGVASNLAAVLDDRFHRSKFEEVSDRADAPIEEALALIVRERLTGMAPPTAAAKLVDVWRPLIESRAGRDLDRLERQIEHQARFGDVVHAADVFVSGAGMGALELARSAGTPMLVLLGDQPEQARNVAELHRLAPDFALRSVLVGDPDLASAIDTITSTVPPRTDTAPRGHDPATSDWVQVFQQLVHAARTRATGRALPAARRTALGPGVS